MATDILDRILADKKMEVDRTSRRIPLAELRPQAEAPVHRRSMYAALKTPGRNGVNVIAEIKRASPSKGVLRADLDAARYARAYQDGGAAAISVLTEKTYFKGSPDDLVRARSASRLPVLRKDFIIDSYQIYESAAMGADAVLLIVRILDRPQLRDYLELARELGLEALVEIHGESELEAASECGARMIGINNRNLKSFDTDIRTAVRVAAGLEKFQIPVAASGIHSRNDIRLNLQAGLFNFLIGESLVRAPDPGIQLRKLIGTE